MIKTVCVFVRRLLWCVPASYIVNDKSFDSPEFDGHASGDIQYGAVHLFSTKYIFIGSCSAYFPKKPLKAEGWSLYILVGQWQSTLPQSDVIRDLCQRFTLVSKLTFTQQKRALIKEEIGHTVANNCWMRNMVPDGDQIKLRLSRLPKNVSVRNSFSVPQIPEWLNEGNNGPFLMLIRVYLVHCSTHWIV